MIARCVGSSGHHVRGVRTAAEILRLGACDAHDLIVLDIGLTDGSGLDVLRKLRDRGFTPIIILSGKTEPQLKIEALDSGADDYVTKPFDPGELRARIDAALRRSLPLPPTIEVVARSVRVGGEVVVLTPPELEILVRLARTNGETIPRAEFHDLVADAVDPDHALDAHASRIRRKLGRAASRFQTVPNVGYRLVL